ncbi:Fibrinogen-like protein 1 [Larimichthys crocea]|uniref:Uncharacterized protein n=1 Tax=Larimichthys crocea TaxID=215358 RepID=A0ACD3RXD5_LARCR|nr:Fibrinogen-like protein 1 [Larimichthys crocea]
MGMLRTSLAFLHLATSLAVPVPCEEKIVRLEAEIQGLKMVIDNQHRYIQDLHNSQAQRLELIPNSHLGPENLYRGNYDLRIDMEDFEGNQRYAEYKNFKVDDEKDQFQLHLGEYTGNAGNALADVRGPRPAGQKWAGPGSGSTRVKFSTYDQLNDESEDNAKCIRHTKAGWWFSKCDAGNLNGHYYKGPYQAMTDDGVVWYTWHGWWYSIKSVVMMVRAADLEHPPPILAPLPGQLDPSKVAGGVIRPQGQ